MWPTHDLAQILLAVLIGFALLALASGEMICY